jgi:hypothetical protein
LPVAHPFLSDFISSVPESFTDTLNSLISRFSNDTSTTRVDPNWNQMSSCTAASTANKSHDEVGQVFNNRLILVKFIKKFHEQAGTLTSQVRNSLRMLSDSDTKVFVSTHQPNLFAYGGIFKKIVLLQALKDSVLNAFDNGLKIINLFVVIDHDFMADVYFKLILTWNECKEGTGIEPAQQIVHNDTRGFSAAAESYADTYIDILGTYLGSAVHRPNIAFKIINITNTSLLSAF